MERRHLHGFNMVLTMEPLTTLVRKVSGGLKSTKDAAAEHGIKEAEIAHTRSRTISALGRHNVDH